VRGEKKSTSRGIRRRKKGRGTEREGTFRALQVRRPNTQVIGDKIDILTKGWRVGKWGKSRSRRHDQGSVKKRNSAGQTGRVARSRGSRETRMARSGRTPKIRKRRTAQTMGKVAGDWRESRNSPRTKKSGWLEGRTRNLLKVLMQSEAALIGGYPKGRSG